MLLACSWSVPSLGPFVCSWPLASSQGCRRCPTLAPRPPSLDRGQKGKGLQLSQAASQVITVVILWLTQHFGAYPPTSRKCYRSTATTRMILSMLLVSFFLPIEARQGPTKVNKISLPARVVDRDLPTWIPRVCSVPCGARQDRPVFRRPTISAPTTRNSVRLCLVNCKQSRWPRWSKCSED